MFDSPYAFQKVSVNETLMPDPIKKIHYRFKAAYRRYFVTLEVYSFNVVAIKYCDIKDKNSGNAYKKIFNDYDAFRVITTCLHIMLDHWKENPAVTFAFYAVSRELTQTIIQEKDITVQEAQAFADEYKRVRFRIYQYAMINLFPPAKFIQLRDSKNCLYMLFNKKQKKPKTTIKKLGQYLLDNYDMIFEPM